MAELFLIPFISILDVHDTAVKEWLESLDTTSIKQYLEHPFIPEKHFPETIRRALASAENIHKELLNLMQLINPQAVFLDISVDLLELENKYNSRLISPSEFWSEYYENISSEMSEPAKTIYRIHLKSVIDRSTGLIESKEHLPLSVVFYGVNKSLRKELIPVYEHLIDKDDEFLLQAARTMNEISPLKERPEHIWYSGMGVLKKGFSYEETERFYHELRFHLVTPPTVAPRARPSTARGCGTGSRRASSTAAMSPRRSSSPAAATPTSRSPPSPSSSTGPAAT